MFSEMKTVDASAGGGGWSHGGPGSPSPSRAVALDALLARSGVTVGRELGDVEVTSIEYDSRRVGPGALFVAIRGFVADGHAFVPEAARRGAVAALVEEATGSTEVLEVVVPDTREALGRVSHEFYGRPSERLTTHAITGTNGKTTTSYLIDSILRETGVKTGVVGTLGYRLGDELTSGDRTSPESLDLARLMAAMVDVGVEAVTMEVSSHALALERTTGLKLDTGTFTNLSRDHLDFHGSIEEYAAAKRKLFDLLDDDGWKPGATAVLNRDDDLGRELIAGLSESRRVATLTYGFREGDVHAEDVESTRQGTSARFVTPAGPFDATLKLVSSFNVMNALAATAVAVSQRVPLAAIRQGLARVERVEGRLDLVREGQDFTVVVDYAHTPDAMEKVLAALADLDPARIITVFGCGGDRDRGKRPIMGEIALRGSDVAIITSDNPRTEDPSAIIRDILATRGASGERASLEVIEDRRQAIERAIEIAGPGDLVLIAGKGHETYQIIGETTIHFDDREEAARAIRALGRGRGDDGEDQAC
jgi:UDP-N-acetylmuramoyl-L-alanyl-D-glutamate--2,6-diaminopimelate ligase